MILAIAIVAAVIAVVVYLRHHSAKVEAEAQKLKSAAENEAKKIEQVVVADAEKLKSKK